MSGIYPTVVARLTSAAAWKVSAFAEFSFSMSDDRRRERHRCLAPLASESGEERAGRGGDGSAKISHPRPALSRGGASYDGGGRACRAARTRLSCRSLLPDPAGGWF